MRPRSIHINKALAEEETSIQFFVETSGGNSSIIRPRAYDEIKIVSAVRLDNLLKEHGIEKVKLLKIEVEGYEPEVLSRCV